MQAHDKVEVFDVYKAIKIPAVNKELYTITVIDLESELLFITSKDPLERSSAGYDIFGDAKANKIV